MPFEWDEAKNLENIRKHEIDFADASAVFEGEMLIEPDERFDYGEDCWFGIGFLGTGVVVIIWTKRRENMIRLISARRANRYERQKFAQYLSDELGST